MFIVLIVRPKIIQKPSKFETGYLSLTKRLTFKVFSIPEATIVWKRPLWTLQDNDRFTDENGTLVISNVTSTDLGLYEGVARNLLGEVKVSTFLTVQKPGELIVLLIVILLRRRYMDINQQNQ